MVLIFGAAGFDGGESARLRLKSSCAANRTARSRRKWSSANRSSGAPMVRMIRARKSSSPPTQSCNFFAHRIVEKAVDGEIAPPGVGLRVAENDPFRAPAILVIRLGAKGGDLELLSAFDDNHHAELASDGNRALEQLLDLLRQGGGDDVVIPRFAAQQEIAHAAADPEGGEAGALAAGGQWPAACHRDCAVCASSGIAVWLMRSRPRSV